MAIAVGRGAVERGVIMKGAECGHPQHGCDSFAQILHPCRSVPEAARPRWTPKPAPGRRRLSDGPSRSRGPAHPDAALRRPCRRRSGCTFDIERISTSPTALAAKRSSPWRKDRSCRRFAQRPQRGQRLWRVDVAQDACIGVDLAHQFLVQIEQSLGAGIAGKPGNFGEKTPRP